MIGRKTLTRDRKGSAALEFAILGPVLIMLIVGIAQLGVLFLSNAEVRNAVGVGARYATIYPRPTETQIKAKIVASAHDLNPNYLTGPTVTYGKSGDADYADIEMSYVPPLKFVFVKVNPVTLTANRRVYLQPTAP